MTRLLLLLAALAAQPAIASPIEGARQLTFEGKRAGEGYFSSDGTKMIFQSEREPGNPFYQIYLLDLATGDVERLSTGIGKTTCGWIHPDSERALFASTQFDPEAEAKMQAELDFRASGQERRYSWDYDPAYEIVATPLDGEGYTRLTEARGYDAEGAYSPDGTRIVFASNRAAYARELSEEEAERLERDPAWFMDLYVMDADGTDVRRLTDAPGYDGGPFWSADGRKITWRRFSEDGARAEVYTMNADGTGERRITHLGAMSWAPFFHPSGEYIVFSSNLEGFANFELYLVDAEGRREPVRVTERDGFDGLASFDPSGGRITWTSNATSDGTSQIFLGDWDHEAALALLAEAPLRDGETPERPAMEETEAAISADDLRLHVAALASDAMEGRLTGTGGEARAAAYVAEAFASVGLAPAGDPGGFYTQGFEFTAGVALGEGNALSVSVGEETLSPALEEGWTPLAFSATGPAAEAEVVFAGYGVVAPDEGDAPGLDSYEGIDVAGKWVLIWRGLPGGIEAAQRTRLARFADLRYRAAMAKQRGAAGVILGTPPRLSLAAPLPELAYEAGGGGGAGLPVVAVDEATTEAMLAALAGGRPALTEAAEAGEPAGAALPGVVVSAEVALDFETRQGRNVLGRLDLDGAPAGEGLPPLVIGAHLDHLGRGETSGSLATAEERGQIHNGADDNASGVAALIEIAQHLASEARAGRLSGARDVVFAAWSGEELGLLGSSHFVEAAKGTAGAETLADGVSAYINMDMIGRLRDRVILSGLGSSEIWAREIERRNAVVGLPVVTNDDTYLPTDATVFYLAEVPILSIFTGAHDDYHTPRDTADTLNYAGMEDIARFVALVARSRATAADEPAWVEVARPERPGGRRMSNVFLGTIPDYAEEGVEGVPISGVVQGGPAEEAGLSGGDVIVGLGGVELSNIYDYVGALNGLVPGDPVEIVVRRGGERVELEIVPGVRE